jgi:hypothetical protein
MVENQSLMKIYKAELQDLLENTGILQEVNRTFFNPIGLNLILNEQLQLELLKTEDDYGVTMHTVDKFKLQVFNEFRNKKHKQRQARLGSIIQTRDLIRADKLEDDINLTPPEVLKLNMLLRCVDNVAYAAKKRLMENSKDKDKDAAEIPFKALYRSLEVDVANNNFIDAATKSILMQNELTIKDEIKKIKENTRKKAKLFREDK